MTINLYTAHGHGLKVHTSLRPARDLVHNRHEVNNYDLMIKENILFLISKLLKFSMQIINIFLQKQEH